MLAALYLTQTFSSYAAHGDLTRLPIIPIPRYITSGQDILVITNKFQIKTDDIYTTQVQYWLQSETRPSPVTYYDSRTSDSVSIFCSISPDIEIPPQGYQLIITPYSITIHGRDEQGLRNGCMTLRQMIRLCYPHNAIPTGEIQDWPDRAVRGMLLDISRDKIPRVGTLEFLIDLWAELKFNQVQLYMEHSFAYPGHEDVWKDATPLTASDIQQLDTFCQQMGIELVPCQNSFGHMERWLKLPRYEPLAEIPGGGTCLDPTNPDSLALMEDLYAKLLPHFNGNKFNICCDEVLELGKGRSADVVKKKGLETVYLDYVLQLRELAIENNKQVLFWGDMLVPFDSELRTEREHILNLIPKDMTALVWGYKPEDPLAAQAEVFRRHDIDIYICPGTSSWTSFLGRMERMYGNINMAVNVAEEYDAKGVLLCEWNWRGWEHMPINFPAYLYGAARFWNHDTQKNIPLVAAIDALLIEEPEIGLGKIMTELGSVYLLQGMTDENLPPYFMAMLDPENKYTMDYIRNADIEGLQQTIEQLDSFIDQLHAMKPDKLATRQIVSELINNAEMARIAAYVVLQRLGQINGTAQDQQLAAELKKVSDDFRKIWLLRNRPGGLSDSLRNFELFIRQWETE